MKYRVFIGLFISLLTFPGMMCCKFGDDGPLVECYKARLEIKGICMNYTISVLSSNMDPSKVEATWTDPSTNKIYKNVFGLGSLCSFPQDIKEGDEFYFTISDKEDQNCATCLAYYPTPDKKLFINVKNSGCGNL